MKKRTRSILPSLTKFEIPGTHVHGNLDHLPESMGVPSATKHCVAAADK
ncbi:MAG: hypothetical protein WBO36_06220 [Saprospiraceae bacterium]